MHFFIIIAKTLKNSKILAEVLWYTLLLHWLSDKNVAIGTCIFPANLW